MEHELMWKYAEDFVEEPPAVTLARQHAHELGVEAVSPATGAQLRFIASAIAARRILEIGTGAGVSGLYLFDGAPQAVLTTIDIEPDYQTSARGSFTGAGVPANRQRFIAGRAVGVLPRMNDGAYDLVLVDAGPGDLLAYVEHGLRTVRAGGVVLVAHALWRGLVTDPARRDDVLGNYRALLQTVRDSPAVQLSLSTVGDGLLQLVKLGS